MESRRSVIVGLAWLAAQCAVPCLRADPSSRPPASSRFSWSMFAGRPIARCAHALTWRDASGAAAPLPLPAPSHPARAVLTAASADDFARAVPLLTAYADSDDGVVAALHDLLRRHKRAVDPGGRATLASTLDCRTWDGRAFRRTLRLGPP